MWKAHIRPHIEHAIHAWSPYLMQDIASIVKVQRAVTRHISGLKGLSHEKRLTDLGWTTLEARRTRGDVILTYQVLSENAELRLNTWHWMRTLADIEGPVRGI